MPSFVSILKQIIDHHLPRDYDYHRIPAPWVQVSAAAAAAALHGWMDGDRPPTQPHTHTRAPNKQIHLLRILARLGHSDQRASEGMYEVLVDAMRRADTGMWVK